MKRYFQLFLIAIAISTTTFGCEKEIFEAANNETPTLQAAAGANYPDQQCGHSRNGTILDNQGNSYGNVEVLNDEARIYLIIQMDNNYFLESIFANFGTTASIPVDNNKMVMEDFMIQEIIPGGKTTYTVSFPTAALPVCNDIVLHTNIAEKNHFGQTVAQHDGWLGTHAIYDGFFFKYCLEVCN